jgi:phage tail-like protein
VAILRDQPYGDHQFRVEIDGLPPEPFAHVLLPVLSGTPVEYREGGDPDAVPRLMPGRPRYGTLTLRRGFHGSLSLFEWWQAAAQGEPGTRRTVAVHLLDESASTVVASWLLHAAWPVRYAVGPLVAHDGAVLYEEAEIACDRVEMR